MKAQKIDRSFAYDYKRVLLNIHYSRRCIIADYMIKRLTVINDYYWIKIHMWEAEQTMEDL